MGGTVLAQEPLPGLGFGVTSAACRGTGPKDVLEGGTSLASPGFKCERKACKKKCKTKEPFWVDAQSSTGHGGPACAALRAEVMGLSALSYKQRFP